MIENTYAEDTGWLQVEVYPAVPVTGLARYIDGEYYTHRFT
jgi:hypothetical protein